MSTSNASAVYCAFHDRITGLALPLLEWKVNHEGDTVLPIRARSKLLQLVCTYLMGVRESS